jgi:hypothetical protein
MDHPRLPRHTGARCPDAAVQAHLALSHGTVAWHTFPPDVRDRVVTLWIELLRTHAHARQSPVERDA